MSEKPKTFGLDPEKLVDLMRIVSDTCDSDNQGSPEQKKSELLYDQLREALLTDLTVSGGVPVISDDLTDVLRLQGSKPIREILQNQDSDIHMIKKIKEYYSKLSEDTDSIIERDVAIVIYYTAIAGAMVFHNEKISKLSYRRLERSFSSLISKSWISTELINLFAEAQKLCRTPSMVQKVLDQSADNISKDSTA
jgi:hypothetical protein